MTTDEIRQQRANLESAISTLSQARVAAMAALADLEPKLNDATAELGRAGLAVRLGEGKPADVTRLQARVRDLESERATHLAVSHEAQKQIAVLEAELVLVRQAESADLYRQALVQRDRALQIVTSMVEDLAPKLDELRRLELEAYSAGQKTGLGHPFRWQAAFDANLAERLGLGRVRPIHRIDIADFAAETSRVLAPQEA